ncbi:Maf family protein [Candidatus Babeliales bacterium]|nr:Maf family protein [Candidatus Babeliales bacterium]
MKNDILYLGSESISRRRLLATSGIEYKILKHNSDECGVDIEHGFENYVLEIAKQKMKHLVFPLKEHVEKDYIFILTADTIVVTVKSKKVFGKPKDVNDAKNMLRMYYKEPVNIITGCCLEKRIFENNNWVIKDKNYWTTNAIVEFLVDEQSLDLYFKKIPDILRIAGGVMIEHDFGQQFCKSINGSYSAIIGLPLFELKQALRNMEFRF